MCIWGKFIILLSLWRVGIEQDTEQSEWYAVQAAVLRTTAGEHQWAAGGHTPWGGLGKKGLEEHPALVCCSAWSASFLLGSKTSRAGAGTVTINQLPWK